MSPFPQTNYFEGHENDRKGNRGFNRPRWNVNETKGSERESNTVRNRKGSNCFQQLHGPVGDNQKSQDKKKMIDAKGNVLDPEQCVTAGYSEEASRAGDFDPCFRGPHHCGQFAPVEQPHPDEHISDGCLQSDKIDPLPGQTVGYLDDAALDQ